MACSGTSFPHIFLAFFILTWANRALQTQIFVTLKLGYSIILWTKISFVFFPVSLAAIQVGFSPDLSKS